MMEENQQSDRNDGKGEIFSGALDTLIKLAQDEKELMSKLIALADERNVLSGRLNDAAEARTLLSEERTRLARDEAAGMTASALDDLPLNNIDLLLIENVGNLVCPAEFKIGEDIRILISSTPEGDDKPYKYPLMFHEADVVLINKVDLLPFVKFDVDAFSKTIRGVNRKVKIFPVSCTTGQGIDEWVAWLLGQVGRK